MSSLSQFAPFASGGLKSYQTGFLNVQGSPYLPQAAPDQGVDSFYTDVTVSSTSTTKSMISVDGSFSANTATSGAFYRGGNDAWIAMGRLTSTTNLRVSTNAFSSLGMTKVSARWQIAEAS